MSVLELLQPFVCVLVLHEGAGGACGHYTLYSYDAWEAIMEAVGRSRILNTQIDFHI